MTFKKDYINYLLHSVINSPNYKFYENYRLKKLADTVISIDDVMKLTYIIGKTSGLEPLFKYLLYISDKIDKAQITIFNLKDNFEYDKQNIINICENILNYKSDNVQNFIEDIESAELSENEINLENNQEISLPQDDSDYTEESDNNISEFTEINEQNLESIEVESNEETDIDEIEENESIYENKSNLELIENQTNESFEEEVFELDKISEYIENSSSQAAENDIKESESSDDNELNIEIKMPSSVVKDEEQLREESLTNEAYYKFENKFFEEVKILEKLLSVVSKECIHSDSSKLNEKCIQSLSEISGITSELANLSRQLSFDLIADIFFTMNLYITKSITNSNILNNERIKLFDSSLALVNSLLKGEDYLNYDYIVDKMEKLKNEITVSEEIQQNDFNKIKDVDVQETASFQTAENFKDDEVNFEINTLQDEQTQTYPSEIKHSQLASSVFKLKYLVKEFEKTFYNISNLQGEYKKYDALDKINELNNALKHIAKISASIKYADVLKLAEVTYVFLKYVKDYRMDMQETEIQQIIKYIIFTFKMLLTSKKPEDFNILVQHLNNPDKIFSDT
jgi:hypothetical protein